MGVIGQIPWNKGKTLSKEYRKKISAGKTGIRLSTQHKAHIAKTQRERLAAKRREEKICDQCSLKSQWIYGVIIKQIGDYIIHLCDSCLLDQYHNMKNDKKIEVVT